jgi:gliding motility-associated-like protein
MLTGTGSGIPKWVPTTGLNNASIYTPIASPTATTTYRLTVTDANNCIISDDVTITLNLLKYNGLISNLFTPNGDGKNDKWFIQDVQSYPGNEVFVYNIYGNEVYTKKGYMNDWEGTYNGSPLPDGTYYYVVKLNSSFKILKGTVNILKNK